MKKLRKEEDIKKMNEDKIIKEFFKILKIENQYYSVSLKQPVLLIGEKHLYKAIKEAVQNSKAKSDSSSFSSPLNQAPSLSFDSVNFP